MAYGLNHMEGITEIFTKFILFSKLSLLQALISSVHLVSNLIYKIPEEVN